MITYHAYTICYLHAAPDTYTACIPVLNLRVHGSAFQEMKALARFELATNLHDRSPADIPIETESPALQVGEYDRESILVALEDDLHPTLTTTLYDLVGAVQQRAPDDSDAYVVTTLQSLLRARRAQWRHGDFDDKPADWR